MPWTGAHTIVFVHAHPDDEALLTSGTMARAVAEGIRVVLVVATDGGAGLASSEHSDDLAAVRARELNESCRALGVQRHLYLGYADSGLHGDAPSVAGGPLTLCRASIEEAAQALAVILREESADVLVTYDRHGGYGHPDHIRSHEVSIRAAELAGTRRIFEATAPRDLIVLGLKLVGLVYRFPPEFDPSTFELAFSAKADITHRVNVGKYIDAKRASMRAHASQATSDSGDRTLAAFLRIPKPVYKRVFGTEYYIERTSGSPAPASR